MSNARTKICLFLLIAAGYSLSSCAESEAPKTCTSRLQCAENEYCENGSCYLDPCQNGVRDSNEGDVDCGQVCDVLCEVGKSCQADEDCALHHCLNGMCVDDESSCAHAVIGDLRITEVLNSADVTRKWDALPSMQSEFVEMANVSSKEIALRSIAIECALTSDSDKKVTIPLSGCLKPKSAIVVSQTPIEGMPDEVTNRTILEKPALLTDSAEYECSIVQELEDVRTLIHVVRVAGMDLGTSGGLMMKDYASTIASNAYSSGLFARLLPQSEINGDSHNPGYCPNGARFADNCDTFCDNNQLDSGETDVDCGGKLCARCELGQSCQQNSDCNSSRCSGNVCIKQSCTIAGCAQGEFCDSSTGTCYACTDGLKNGLETDVDCGGTQCTACDAGKSCLVNTDCKSMSCRDGVCVGDDVNCQKPVEGDLEIAEVLNKIKSGSSMTAYDASLTAQAEFIEIVNQTENWIDLSGVTLNAEPVDSSSTPIQIALEQCVAPHQAIVVSGNAISKLPNGVLNLYGKMAESNALNNTAAYVFRLKTTDDVLDEVSDDSTHSEAISHVFHTSSDVASVDHDKINAKLKSSPGYCTNGALYVDACDTFCHNGMINDGETDVDCGGNLCDACGNGQKCTQNRDCISANCLANGTCGGCGVDGDCGDGKCDVGSGVCYSCQDGVQNGTETDVDCGGALCGASCPIGSQCTSNGDCASDHCTSNGVCGEPRCQADEDCGGATCNKTSGVCETCDDGVKNQDETDEDCGGNRCSACGDGKQCTQDADCTSNSCGTSGVCESCTDNLQNQDETDVDCGGSCGLCSLGKTCQSNLDCLSQNCSEKGICIGEDLECVAPKAGELVVAEFFNNVSANAKMTLYDASITDQKQKEFIELVNVSDHPVDLSSVTLTLTPDSGNATTLSLHGCLNANEVMLLTGNEIDGLPDGVFNDSSQLSASNAFTNTRYYAMTMTSNGSEIFAGNETAVMPSATSSVHSQPYAQSNSVEFVRHDAVNAALKHSPGFCTNGNLYRDQCAALCENGRRDGDETDVDCGGSCGATCESGNQCAIASDCNSGECTSGICTGSAAVQATLSNLLINEVMGSPKTSLPFLVKTSTDDTGVTVAAAQCEFVEIVNQSSNKINVSGITLELYKDSGAEVSNSIPLKAIVPARGVLVVSECDAMNLPADAVHMKASLKMTNGNDYLLKLRQSDAVASAVLRSKLSSANGKSQMRAQDRVDAASTSNGVETLQMHDKLSDLNKHSPGYCLNGKQFSQDCQ